MKTAPLAAATSGGFNSGLSGGWVTLRRYRQGTLKLRSSGNGRFDSLTARRCRAHRHRHRDPAAVGGDGKGESFTGARAVGLVLAAGAVEADAAVGGFVLDVLAAALAEDQASGTQEAQVVAERLLRDARALGEPADVD